MFRHTVWFRVNVSYIWRIARRARSSLTMYQVKQYTIFCLFVFLILKDNCSFEAGMASKNSSNCFQFRKTVKLWDWNTYWINVCTFYFCDCFFFFFNSFFLRWMNQRFEFRFCLIQKLRLARCRLQHWRNREMCYDGEKILYCCHLDWLNVPKQNKVCLRARQIPPPPPLCT